MKESRVDGQDGPAGAATDLPLAPCSCSDCHAPTVMLRLARSDRFSPNGQSAQPLPANPLIYFYDKGSSVDSLPKYDSEQLIGWVRQLAYQRGNFTLASGATASFYLDCRKLTLHPQGLIQVSAGLLEILQRDGLPAAVGGMVIGADPITAGLVHLAGMHQLPLRGFMVRKEPKGHGLGQQVEGPVQPGEEVVIVEDVVTSGGSSVKAIAAARDFGLVVKKVLAIVDRQAGGREAFAEVGVEFESLLTIDQIHTEVDG